LAATVVVKTANGTAISVNGIIIDPTNASPGNALVFSGGQFVPGAGGGGGVTQAYQTVQANLTPRTQRNIINFQTRFTAVDNAGNFSTDIDLAATGVGAGTYTSVTVDAYGRVTGGTNPAGSTTLGNAYATGGAGGGVIGLTASGGGLIVRDNATPIAATLLGAQNSAGSVKYLDVTASGAYAPNYWGAMVTVTFSNTPTFTVASGETQTITLTGNVTSYTVTNGTGAGQLLTLIWVQDASGSRTLAAPPGNVKLAGGAFTLSTAVNSRDSITFRWDSVASVWQEIGRGLATSPVSATSLQTAYNGGNTVAIVAGTDITLTLSDIRQTTSNPVLTVQNPTAATAGITVQNSPALRFYGAAWNSTAVASQNTWWSIFCRPNTVAGPIYSDLVFFASPIGAPQVEAFKLAYDGAGTTAMRSTQGTLSFNNNQDTGIIAATNQLQMQVSGSPRVYLDTTGMWPFYLTHLCGSATNYWQQVNSKHYVSQGTAPSIAVGTAAQLGTGPSAALSGTDTAGVITITTGTAVSTPTLGVVYVLATITFNTPFGAAPQSIMINPANDNASKIYALGSVAFSNNDTTTTTWKLSWGGNTGLANSTVYKFQYIVIG